jgi:antitoxin component YwqK of YwqJK toxin-antitoxin module
MHLPKWTALALLCTSCVSQTGEILSQSYVHKYGFNVSSDEWNEREQDGQVITLLKSGVKITESYENGVLQGPTTYTYPHSPIIEKTVVYDQGNLIRETQNDATGMPLKEEAFEFENRKAITVWDEKGSPLSIEEYAGDLLVEGKYFTPDHELEGRVENGYGERVKRDRSGLLLSREEIADGAMIARTTYHSNGHIQSISHYDNYQLHGEQQKFSVSGRPLMNLEWKHGLLDGTKVVYRNGLKAVETPYVDGKKHGLERHFDDLGYLTAAIPYLSDKKHGKSTLYTEESTETEWYYNGELVSNEKFENLEERARIIADMNGVIEQR